MIYCAEFGRLGGLIKKLFNSVLSAHRLSAYLESVALMVSEKRSLNMTVRQTERWTDRRMDRLTDERTWLNRFFSSR